MTTRPRHLLPTAHLTLLTFLLVSGVHAQEPAPATPLPVPEPAAAAAPEAPTPPARVEGTRIDIESQLRDAMNSGDPTKKKLNLLIDRKSAAGGLAPGSPPPLNPVDHLQREPGIVIRQQRAATKPTPKPAVPVYKAIPWSYEGEGGPGHWAQLKPEFSTCAKGQRQSPIAIDDADTLKGPAEAIAFNYAPSSGTVVNNGHTIEVQLSGDNSLTVRGQTYRLQQFHFHHPAEERINSRVYPMVAHFVHRSDAGQLAVLAVLLEEGPANPLIQKVWTHMPLDVKDHVPLPAELIHVGEILPRDQRYYQYMGSLTTPPCTEGVLWLILKQPASISADQLRLFGQLYPNNARPVQSLNGRPVRDALLIAPGGRP
ncbi:MAG: carbonic anhydrase [Hylemonella sp.]|uniref:carbonic anhydrase n=1 Tax=Hylemonella sp. TaxID=2066020 RepID=UPI00391956DA